MATGTKVKNAAKQRPAEVTTVGAAVAFLLVHYTGIATSPNTLTALGFVIGLIPAAVTWAYTSAEQWGWIRPAPDLPNEFAAILPDLATACQSAMDAAKASGTSVSDRSGALTAVAQVLTAVQISPPASAG